MGRRTAAVADEKSLSQLPTLHGVSLWFNVNGVTIT
jgi:hypothetical protein